MPSQRERQITERAVCPQCGKVYEPVISGGMAYWPLTNRGRILCPDDRATLVRLPLTSEARESLRRILEAD